MGVPGLDHGTPVSPDPKAHDEHSNNQLLPSDDMHTCISGSASLVNISFVSKNVPNFNNFV